MIDFNEAMGTGFVGHKILMCRNAAFTSFIISAAGRWAEG
jgi:hypothetical protein